MSGLEDFCCVCVKKYPNLENINETNENTIKYRDKLEACTGDQISWCKSYNICENCIEKLDLTYSFIQLCLQSEHLRQEQLKILKEQKSRIPPVFICAKCDKKFKQKKTLILHLQKAHVNTSQKPSETIKQENLELIEKKEDFSEGEENINNYSTDDEVEPQIKKSYGRRKVALTCEYCGKSFNRRQHYTAHIRSKHTFEKPYKCDLCDAKYATSHSLLVHKRNHNNEKPFICSYCGKGFVCSGDLYHHIKIHLNKREYLCDLCERSFNTASILRTHKICMHMDPKNWKYICSFCNRKFPINSSLVAHKKRHVGFKEFICHICEKNFFDRSELSKHLRTHSSERLFKCNLCEGKEYKNNYGLKKHMKIKHNVGTIKISKPAKKFACTLCPRAFICNSKLQQHLCAHRGEKPFRCKFCDRGFIDNYNMKMHLKKKHNITPVQTL